MTVFAPMRCGITGETAVDGDCPTHGGNACLQASGQVGDATAMAYLLAAHDYSRLPSHLRPGLERWIREATPVGGFLSALLCNDLSRAVALADHQSLYALPVLVSWLTNRAPSPCWGSPAAVAEWKGLPQWIDVA